MLFIQSFKIKKLKLNGPATNMTKRDLFFESGYMSEKLLLLHRFKKLDLIYHFVEEKSKSFKYWKGSVDTP